MKTKNITFCLILLISGNVFAQQNKSNLSDDFNTKKSLQKWSRFYDVEGWPDMMKRIDVENGHLVMEPYTCGWYADYHAPFIFKLVSGDFEVSTKLKISGIKSKNPNALWSLAGLMVRVPRNITPSTWKPNEENWIFLTTGIADNFNQPVFETKNTINSSSKLKLHPNKLDWVSLKIKRKGSSFSLFYKYDDEDWTLLESFKRQDFPETLQVGINSYTDFYSADNELMKDYKKYNTTVVKYGKPDLKVVVDFIKFK